MPAVKVRRINPEVVDLAEEVRQAAEERHEVAEAQRLQLQGEAQRFLTRLGKGLTAWQEHGWEWIREGMAGESPEAWKGLPKVVYLLAQFEHAQSALEHFEFAPNGPLWCKACHEGEEMPSRWYMWECFEHVNAAVLAVNVGSQIFGDLQ